MALHRPTDPTVLYYRKDWTESGPLSRYFPDILLAADLCVAQIVMINRNIMTPKNSRHMLWCFHNGTLLTSCPIGNAENASVTLSGLFGPNPS